MPYWRLYYHLVWTTKNRMASIDARMESLLHPYLKSKAVAVGCVVDAINGTEDHIHMVLSIPPVLSISDLVQRLKGASSHDFPELYWQRGYGVLSLGERQRSTAVEYVNNQKIHHGQQTINSWLERCDETD